MSVVSLICTGVAHADPVPWSYQWTPSTLSLTSDGPGLSKLLLSNEPTGTAAGNSDIVATNLQVLSTADPNHPDTFTHKAYSLTLTIADNASKATGNLVFTGEFNGTASAGSAHIENTFTGSTTMTLALGNNTYIVTIGPYTPPGPPGSTKFGAISATVVVKSGSSSTTPEPSSMVLAGLGLSLVGVVGWRKRRRRQVLAGGAA
jgi:hypothetical protein